MPDTVKPKSRKRLNRDERRAVKAAAIRTFADQYGRKAQKGAEPNDRRYDKGAERLIKQMDPEEFDRLLRDDED